MSVKEVSIVAGIIGGAGGAGTSYATNNFGFGFGVTYVKDPNFRFVPLGCIEKTKFAEGEIDKLVQKIPESAGIVDAPSTLGNRLDTIKKGCLKIQSFGWDTNGTRKFSRIAFELTAWKEDTDPSEGIVIWSSLTLGKDNKNSTLLSRVFYLKKDTEPNSKLFAEKGLEFITTIEGVTDENALKGLLKEIKAPGSNGTYMSLNAKKEYEWTSGSDFKFLEQIQISSNSKIALFFGRDSADSNNKLEAQLSGVYDKKVGWNKPKDRQEITYSIFKTDKQGKWTAK